MRIPNPTPIDPRFSVIRQALSSLEEGFESPSATTSDRIQAAVSMVLREGEELELLLIRRAEAEHDPWSGQMALPGGRRDPADPSLLHTAVRETKEEVSLNLEEKAVQLGRLQPMAPATRRLPPITIFPYVFAVPGEAQAQVASPEVDEVIWVPLAVLQDPESASTVDIRYGDGGSRTFPCIRVEERVIWGLTYRILTGFLELIQDRSPVLPPTRQ